MFVVQSQGLISMSSTTGKETAYSVGTTLAVDNLGSLGSHIDIVLWERREEATASSASMVLIYLQFLPCIQHAVLLGVQQQQQCLCIRLLTHSASLTVMLIITQCMSCSYANIQSASARYETITYTCYRIPPQGIFLGILSLYMPNFWKNRE